MNISNKKYDFFKWLVLTALPAFSVLVSSVGSELNWNHTHGFVAITNAITAFLGTILGISSRNYHKKTGGEKNDNNSR